ncbi:hypothetical protein QOT17_018632 [Balamuthia mandrillaris]
MSVSQKENDSSDNTYAAIGRKGVTQNENDKVFTEGVVARKLKTKYAPFFFRIGTGCILYDRLHLKGSVSFDMEDKHIQVAYTEAVLPRVLFEETEGHIFWFYAKTAAISSAIGATTSSNAFSDSDGNSVVPGSGSFSSFSTSTSVGALPSAQLSGGGTGDNNSSSTSGGSVATTSSSNAATAEFAAVHVLGGATANNNPGGASSFASAVGTPTLHQSSEGEQVPILCLAATSREEMLEWVAALCKQPLLAHHNVPLSSDPTPQRPPLDNTIEESNALPPWKKSGWLWLKTPRIGDVWSIYYCIGDEHCFEWFKRSEKQVFSLENISEVEMKQKTDRKASNTRISKLQNYKKIASTTQNSHHLYNHIGHCSYKIRLRLKETTLKEKFLLGNFEFLTFNETAASRWCKVIREQLGKSPNVAKTEMVTPEGEPKNFRASVSLRAPNNQKLQKTLTKINAQNKKFILRNSIRDILEKANAEAGKTPFGNYNVNAPLPNDGKYRIITFDGGGLRSVISITILVRLTQVFPDLLERVNLFCGTSGGAIMAAGLSAGRSPTTMREILMLSSKYLFARKSRHFVTSARYSNDMLRLMCEEGLGNLRLCDVKKGLMIATFLLDNGKVGEEFHSWIPRIFHNLPPAAKTSKQGTTGRSISGENGDVVNGSDTATPTKDNLLAENVVSSTTPSAYNTHNHKQEDSAVEDSVNHHHHRKRRGSTDSAAVHGPDGYRSPQKSSTRTPKASPTTRPLSAARRKDEGPSDSTGDIRQESQIDKEEKEGKKLLRSSAYALATEHCNKEKGHSPSSHHEDYEGVDHAADYDKVKEEEAYTTNKKELEAEEEEEEGQGDDYFPIPTWPSDEDRQTYLKDLIMASTAAPTFFPSWKQYVDGGIFAHNPSMAAVTAASSPDFAHRRRLDQIEVLSLGTGRIAQFVEGEDHDWGLMQWARKIPDMLFGGAVWYTAMLCKTQLGTNFHRLDPILPKPIAMDDPNQLQESCNVADAIDLTDTIEWVREHFYGVPRQRRARHHRGGTSSSASRASRRRADTKKGIIPPLHRHSSQSWGSSQMWGEMFGSSDESEHPSGGKFAFLPRKQKHRQRTSSTKQQPRRQISSPAKASAINSFPKRAPLDKKAATGQDGYFVQNGEELTSPSIDLDEFIKTVEGSSSDDSDSDVEDFVDDDDAAFDEEEEEAESDQDDAEEDEEQHTSASYDQRREEEARSIPERGPSVSRRTKAHNYVVSESGPVESVKQQRTVRKMLSTSREEPNAEEEGEEDTKSKGRIYAEGADLLSPRAHEKRRTFGLPGKKKKDEKKAKERDKAKAKDKMKEDKTKERDAREDTKGEPLLNLKEKEESISSWINRRYKTIREKRKRSASIPAPGPGATTTGTSPKLSLPPHVHSSESEEEKEEQKAKEQPAVLHEETTAD